MMIYDLGSGKQNTKQYWYANLEFMICVVKYALFEFGYSDRL